MQEKNAHYAKNILKRLKKTLNISTDTSLSEILDIKPNTISSWKKRNTLDYSKIIDKCIEFNIDLNLIFNDNFIEERPETLTPIVSKNLIYQYTNGELKKSFNDLPTIKFPYQKNKETLAFQTLKNIINQESSNDCFAVSERILISEVQNGDLVIIISKKLGFFTYKIKRSSPNSEITFVSIEEKTAFNKNVSISIEDIDELWKVTSILSII